MTKDCTRLPNVLNYIKQGQPSSQPVVHPNPFPSPQQMFAQDHVPPSGGASSSSTTILMTDTIIGLSMRAKNYEKSEGHPTKNDTPSTSQPDLSPTLEKPTFELPSHPSKEIVHQTMHNFNTWATQHYTIVEDLSQAPCAMSTLEVLQS